MLNLYGLKLDHVPTGPVSATDQNRRGHILNAQLNLGALGALGAGVHHGWEVTLSGGVVTVAPGAGQSHSEENGYIAFATPAAMTVPGLPPVAPYYIYAVPVLASTPGGVDSRETFLPTFVANESDVLDEAVLLARINADNTVTDLRVPTLAMQAAQVMADLGYDAAARAKGTVRARLDALTGGDPDDPDAPPPAVITYLTQLKWSEADPRNAVTVIEERLDALQATLLEAIATGGIQESQSDVDQLFEVFLPLLVRAVGETNPALLRLAPVAFARPGIYGTATAGDSALHDLGGTLPERTTERDYSPV